MTKGKFIVVEGLDGAGKSLAVNYINSYLTKEGLDVVRTKDPGGTEFVDQLKPIVISNIDSLDSRTELLLFLAMRNELITKVIIPGLQEGKVVVCDRFADSTYIYQGILQDRVADVLRFQSLLDKIPVPDMVFLLDITVEESVARISNRSDNNEFDVLSLTEKKIMREAYLDIYKRSKASESKTKYYLIDANQSVRKVHMDIQDILNLEVLP